MTQHTVSILLLSQQEDEWEDLQGVLRETICYPVRFLSAVTLDEAANYRQQEEIDIIILKLPIAEDKLNSLLQWDKGNTLGIVFVKAEDQHLFWIHSFPGNVICLVLDEKLACFQSAARMIRSWIESDDFVKSRQSQQTLRNQLKQYRMIADFTTDWEYWLSPENKLIYISPSCQQITGYSPQAFYENPNLLLTIVHPVDRPGLIKHLLDKDITHPNLEFRITTRSGELRWIGHNCQPVYDEDGHYCGFRASNRDITEQKHAERVLKEQRNLAVALSTTHRLIDSLEEVMKTALQIHPIDCSWVHLVGKISKELNLVAHKGIIREFTNAIRNFPANAPYTQRMMSAKPVYIGYQEIVNGFDGIHFPPREELRSACSIPVQYRGEIVAVLSFGSHTYNSIPLPTRDILEGFAAQMGGVIARTKAETGLAENITNLQLIFNLLEEMILVLNLEGRIIYYNSIVQERLGYQETELLSMTIDDLLPVNWSLGGISTFSELSGELLIRHPVSLRSKEGSLIPSEISILRGRWGEDNVLFCILHETAKGNG